MLLVGCAVGPDYAPPSLPSLHSSQFPASFGEPTASLALGAVEVAWWRAFDDPTLATLVQRALAANHDIGIAAARLEEANAMLRENRQGFLPRGGGPRSAMRTVAAVNSRRRLASRAGSKPTAVRSTLPGKSISLAACGDRWRRLKRKLAPA